MPSAIALKDGNASALGAVADAQGVNFALFSAHAERVELCLFANGVETARLPLPARTADIWHGYLEGAAPGPGIWLSCPWTLRAAAGPPLQSRTNC